MTSRLAPGAPAVLLVILLGLAAGCADDSSIDATTVLDYNQCAGLEPGLTLVDYAAVAAIRGGKLLGITEPDENATRPDQGDLVLVAISRGRQPTPGYGFTLDGAHRQDNAAVLTVRWESPEPGAMLAQVVSHPCLVVGVPRAGLDRIEAVDQHGARLGSLDL
jgi:hypothetical protein